MSGAVLGSATLFGLCGAALAGLGLYAIITAAALLRRILGFNLLGAGIFLVFGSVSRHGAGAGFGGDPVPQAMVITGVVVAFAATALAVALAQRLFDLTGAATLEAPPRDTGPRSEP